MAPNQPKAAYHQSQQLTPAGLLDFTNKYFVFEDLPLGVLHDLFHQFNDFLVAQGEDVYFEEMHKALSGSPEPEVWVRFVDERQERFFCYIFPSRAASEEYKDYVAKRKFMSALRTHRFLSPSREQQCPGA